MLVRTCRKLMRTYNLSRINISIGEKTVTADAIPTMEHPMVKQRIEKAYQDHERSEISVNEISQIQRDSIKTVAHVIGATADEAVSNLTVELQRA
jgi:hypothetical protein